MQSNLSRSESVPSLARSSDLTVIIPTLNEVGSIAELLRMLCEQLPGVSVMVVDDQSNDGTPEAVMLAAKQAERRGDSSIELLERPHAAVRGITASVLDAITRVRTPCFVVMDGDLQHPVDVVPKIFEQLREGTDLVVAARASLPEEFGRVRTALSRAASKLASLRLSLRGIHVDDPLSGFFGARTEFFREGVRRTSEAYYELRGYKVLFDFMKNLPRPDRRAYTPKVQQVYYRFGIRKRGESKLAPLHVWCFLRSLIS